MLTFLFIVTWLGIFVAIINMYVTKYKIKNMRKFDYTRMIIPPTVNKGKYSEYYNSFKNVLLKKQPITINNRFVCSLINETTFAVYDIDTKNIVELELSESNFERVMEHGI